jgi:hypothetical protein
MVDYPIYKVLFIDIETVSRTHHLEELQEEEQALWKQKAKYWLKDYADQADPEAVCYENRAAILAEFGRIICISVGIHAAGDKDGEDTFRLKSFAGDDEEVILREFGKLMDEHFSDPNKAFLCGHNIREFDIPYICRRMLMLGIPLPNLFQISGKKPWQISYLIDTLELWKFGDIKHFISLKLLTWCLGIPSPKEDIEGSDVGRVYYVENDLPSIVRYCERDVLAVAQVLRKMMGLPLLAGDAIVSTSHDI